MSSVITTTIATTGKSAIGGNRRRGTVVSAKNTILTVLLHLQHHILVYFHQYLFHVPLAVRLVKRVRRSRVPVVRIKSG